MKIKRTFLALTLAALGACSDQGTPANPPQNPGSAPAANAAAEEPLLGPEDAAIPTEMEAADQAAKSIDESNADAELEKLKSELEGGK